MKKIYFFTLMIFSVANHCMAQISFTNSTATLNAQDNYSGVAMGVLDMNGDGLDDILRLDQGSRLNIVYQSNNGFQNVEYGEVAAGSQWSICAGDLDNDGINEVFTGGYYSNNITTIDQETSSFDKVDLVSGDEIFSQAANFVDINNDGFLDLFVCNDDGASYTWGNDGSGNMSRNEWIDMSEDGDFGEAASGNYGSVWTDIDNDGDVDLYIAKCRQGVTNVEDPRRINQLYINDGNGGFSERASEFGLASGWQSWTADFGDVNNDGWMDCFVTNHDHRAQLFISKGDGSFDEVDDTGLDLSGIPIQGIFRDFDNDGFLDVLVAGSDAQLFRNNGDLTFTEVENLFNEDNMESFGLGDLNNDGYIDIYGGYANIYTTPSSINDKLWLNTGGINNYVAVKLQGVFSNRNAIGARVEIYGDWGKQIREVRAGEGYGIINSESSYFGLGEADHIDSLIVIWPSGLKQTEIDVAINTKFTILEGGCLADSPLLEIIGETEFCPGDSLILIAEDGFDSYEWSNGSDGQSIVVKETGNYALTVLNEEGCTGFSKVINVVVDPKLYPEIATENNIVEICFDSEITLSQIGNLGSTDLIWNTGESGSSIMVDASGEYFVTASGLCSDFPSSPIAITVFEELSAPDVIGDNIQLGEVAEVSAIGDNLVWFGTEESSTIINEGETFQIEGLTESTSFFVADRSGYGQTGYVGMEAHSGSEYSPNPGDNNSILFNAMEDFVLDSVTVYTDLPGERIIVLRNSTFDELARKSVVIEAGKSTVYLGMEIKAETNLRLTTDFTSNFELTGNFGPRLQRSDENINYPYIMDGVVELVGSDFSTDWYFYFYYWKVSTGVLCEGERSEVNIVVEPVGTIDPTENALQIFPNPVSDFFTIEFTEDVEFPAIIKLYNVTGEVVVDMKTISKSERVDTKSLSAGFYTVSVKSNNRNYISKIIKQ